MRPRRLFRVVMLNGACRDCCASGGRVTSDGSCQVPVATWAATRAMVSGLTLTFPWPMVAAASWATPLVVPTDPENPGSGNCQRRPKPNPSAALLSFAALSPWDSPLNAVTHDFAKSAANVAPGFLACAGTLRKLCPPTELTGLQGMVLFVATPLASSAAVDTMVKAPPGGKRPASGAIDGIRWALWPATARMPPVDARIATMAAEPGAAATARMAASWTRASIVVCTEVGARPDQVFSTRTVRPLAVSATTSVVGVPAR